MNPFQKTASAILATGLIAGTAQAQSRDHLDRTARQLQAQLRDLHDEAHTHFRSTPQFREMDRHIGEMQQKAAHIQEVIRRRGGVDHLRADVRDLDRLLHHVEDLVDALGRSGQIDRQAFAHLRQSLRRVSQSVHHLSEDLSGGHGGHGHDH